STLSRSRLIASLVLVTSCVITDASMHPTSTIIVGSGYMKSAQPIARSHCASGMLGRQRLAWQRRAHSTNYYVVLYLTASDAHGEHARNDGNRGSSRSGGTAD